MDRRKREFFDVWQAANDRAALEPMTPEGLRRQIAIIREAIAPFGVEGAKWCLEFAETIIPPDTVH